MIRVSLVKDASGKVVFYLLDNQKGLTLLAYVKDGDPSTQEILDFLIGQVAYSELLFDVSGRAEAANIEYVKEQHGEVTLEFIGTIPFAE